MPYIIILTGHPCSGKSTLANKIRERALLTQHQSIERVVIVDELTANTTVTNIEAIAQLCYRSSSAEKVMRGALKSAFDRAVASAVHDEKITSHQNKKKTLIILDSTNYIKGYRYELYCICKAATGSYCVVWCLNDVGTVKEWNRRRRDALSDRSSGYYTDEILDALILRYEPPDERNRWDQPLYRIDLRTAEQIEQEQQQKQGTGIAEQLLHQSLYNMHNLSEALATNSETGPSVLASPTTVEEGLTSIEKADVPKIKASSTFKRSAFQKKTTNSTGSSNQSSTTTTSTTTTTKPMTLTAEALSSFSNALSSSGPLDVTKDASTISFNNGVTRKQKRHPSNIEQPQYFGHRTMDEQVDDFLFQFIRNTQPLKEGTSTRQHRSVESDVLHTVDTITQQLCSVINDIITTTEIDYSTTNHIEIPFRNKIWYLDCSNTTTTQQQIKDLLSFEALREIRTKYVQWIRKNPIEELENSGNSTTVIIESFLSYITTQIQQQL